MMDCSETTNFLNEWQRMCKTVSCGKCGLNGDGKACKFFAQSNPERAIEIVQEWSDAHPEKTRLSVLKEAFPNAKMTKDGLPFSCVSFLYGIKCPYFPSSLSNCKKCWDTPIEQEVQ